MLSWDNLISESSRGSPPYPRLEGGDSYQHGRPGWLACMEFQVQVRLLWLSLATKCIGTCWYCIKHTCINMNISYIIISLSISAFSIFCNYKHNKPRYESFSCGKLFQFKCVKSHLDALPKKKKKKKFVTKKEIFAIILESLQ